MYEITRPMGMTYVKTLVAATLSCLLALGSPPTLAQESPQKLPTVKLNAGFHVIEAEVARSPGERAIGLMHRKEMPQNHGMLFVFEQPATQCFWMKNTLLPLSIAFLADDGTVVNMADMKPRSLDSHCSKAPVRLALEMNEGWFARRGIREGSRISGPGFAPQTR